MVSEDKKRYPGSNFRTMRFDRKIELKLRP